jgi:phospholipid/cholesterol/gamma-HCH transport system substrate-binding protein
VKFSNEAKVGILVTVALAALLWGLNYLKGKDVFTSRNTYYAVYDNVDGLVKSNPVFMNGFRIGIVNAIDFMPDKSGKLLVTLKIDRHVFVSKDAIAKIFNSDLIGTKAMRIDLGASLTPANDDDTLFSELESGLAQQLGKQVGPIKDKTEHLIVSLDSVVQMMHVMFDPATQNNLKSGIGHLNNSLASIDHMVSDDNGKLQLMISNINSITGNLKSNQQQINNILNNISKVSDSLAAANFAETIRKADEVLAQSQEMLTKINQGKGSLGKMVNDQQLYDNLTATSHDLDELMKDLKANPKRYVHFSVFGKKSK